MANPQPQQPTSTQTLGYIPLSLHNTHLWSFPHQTLQPQNMQNSYQYFSTNQHNFLKPYSTLKKSKKKHSKTTTKNNKNNKNNNNINDDNDDNYYNYDNDDNYNYTNYDNIKKDVKKSVNDYIQKIESSFKEITDINTNMQLLIQRLTTDMNIIMNPHT
jgi:hypothetical protein